MPDSVGVPLMVILLAAQTAVTPLGSPVAVPMPVARVVLWVILVTSGVLIHSVGVEDAADTVLFAFTMIVPVAFTVPHPPVKGIE